MRRFTRVTRNKLAAFQRESQRPPVDLVHIQRLPAGPGELKVNRVRGSCMPLFLTLPDSLIEILERRNRRIQPELIPVRVVPLTNRSTRRSRAVLQVVAKILSHRQRVTIIWTATR